VIARLAIANRGEIARRIITTATSMGIETVAMFSDGDAGSPHVRDSDLAVRLPGQSASETYLNVDAVVDAALRSRADALHPGYGFLSERADLARAAIAAGLTWVGPTPEVIAAMGDKLAAKSAMAAAGVPTLPTWTADDPSVELPVLVKAAAGGGGKGMRVVTTRSELPGALEAAAREASAAFGDPTVFLERLVQRARHIEVQILADSHGNFVHLFERECSVQRRHQKIIEECPSSALDDEQRRLIGDAALRGARAVGYLGAGTVEFVVEEDGSFWFLEVNTRIQVEHPVTEAVTGVDLVREQLLVAAGEALSVCQDDLSICGHAIEARLYAEDPANGFLPCTGNLAEFTAPSRPALRWESGVERGSVVGIDFDPMLAKVISHAPSRAEAARSLALGLSRARVRGVVTNRDFLVASLRSPAFLNGETTTDFVDTAGVPRLRDVSEEELAVAAAAACLAARQVRRSTARALRNVPGGWRNSVMPAEQASYTHRGQNLEVCYHFARDGSATFVVNASTLVFSGIEVIAAAPGLEVRASLGGSDERCLHVLETGPKVWVQSADGDVELDVVERFAVAGSTNPEGALVSPMPGRVVRVSVAAGDIVAAGAELVVIEAMKMEHKLTAPMSSRVSEVRAGAGDQVAAGQLLVVVEDVGQPAASEQKGTR
jgi:propionyl-CoA carboxylase alpha chain